MSDPAARVSIRVLRTSAHACGYWPDRIARNVVFDSAHASSATYYPSLLAQGFRRSGETLYRPDCGACTACVPVRVPVAEFRANRSQRRCLARNADVAVTTQRAAVQDEMLELYCRYLIARHPHSPMHANDAAEFAEMLLARFADSRFLCLRIDGVLRGVAITDVTASACSAVYTFYEPSREWVGRSLGSFAILSQIALTRSLGLPHLYLGYWLEDHPRMDYKRSFRPQERLTARGWIAADAVDSA